MLRNIRDALTRNGFSEFEVINEWSRLFVEVPKDQEPQALEVLSRVFGIVSLSPVQVFPFRNLNDLAKKGELLYKDIVSGKTFAVRAKRVGTHPFRSIDIERKLGGHLSEYGKVDLSHPDVTVEVEVRDHTAYFFLERIPGAGGLPIGAEGKALALVSGGFDSIVAAYLMLKRGVEVDFLFFNLGGIYHLHGAFEVVQAMSDRWAYGYKPVFYEIDFRPVMLELQEKVKQNYWNLILKRQMYRAAERLARQKDYPVIVTGESVGQVSSQTLANLAVATKAVEIPIFRPLLTYDKQEIIDLSRHVGTYDLSAKLLEYCQMVPKHPVTRATEERVLAQERDLDWALLERLVKQARVYKVRDTHLPDLDHLECGEIPEGAQVVDVRSEEERKENPFAADLWIPVEELPQRVEELDKTRPLVLVCEHGFKSMEAAWYLRNLGFEAYSLKGGLRTFRKKARMS